MNVSCYFGLYKSVAILNVYIQLKYDIFSPAHYIIVYKLVTPHAHARAGVMLSVSIYVMYVCM